MLIDECVLDHVLEHAQRTMPAAWAAALETTARKLVRNRKRILELPDGALQLDFERLGPYVATPDSCTCKLFQRCRTCGHRLMAELYQRYCEALSAQPVGGSAD